MNLSSEALDLLRSVYKHFENEGEAEQSPGHCHDIPGVWDEDNKPEIAGKPCEWCAVWEQVKALVKRSEHA